MNLKMLLIRLISPLRALVMKKVRPSSKYFLGTRSLKPISTKFGFDRGKPIDRYYIEKFLDENKSLIKGRCLEIVDNTYTKKFGGKDVKSDVLDMFPTKIANIHGDLKNLKGLIGDNTYDCLIITHTLGMIDDYESAIRECYRILKPGGVLFVTVSCFSPVWEKMSMWRFTVSSARYVFGKYFTRKNLFVRSYGNVLAGQCFWVGMAVEDLTKEELDYNDNHFPCIVTVKAIK